MIARFIHTADWQLGKNYDRIADPDKKARLRRERIEVIARIGAAAEAHQAEFILVAGDLFDSPTATKETVVNALSAIGKLHIPVIAIPGNHDHGGPAGLWDQKFFRDQQLQLAPNFTILLEAVPYETPTAWILPCPLLRRSESSDLTAWIREAELSARINDGKPVVLLAHGGTQSFGSYDDEEGEGTASNRIELDRLPAGLVDYVALGDWHGTKEIKPWAWYSGTPEPDRFNKGNDHSPGNVLAVEVERGGAPQVQVKPTTGLGWHNVAFDFTDDTSFEAFQERVTELIANRTGDDLLQVDLSGSLGLAAASRLGDFLETLDARLLRLKLRDDTRITPTQAEIDGLTLQSNDPLIKRVAVRLMDMVQAGGEPGELARVALQELFAKASAN